MTDQHQPDHWGDFIDKMIMLVACLTGISLYVGLVDFYHSRNWQFTKARVLDTRMVCRLSKREWYQRPSRTLDEYCDDEQSIMRRQAEGWQKRNLKLLEVKIEFDDTDGRKNYATLLPPYSDAAKINKSDLIDIRYPEHDSSNAELASTVGRDFSSAILTSGVGAIGFLGLYLWRRRMRSTPAKDVDYETFKPGK